MKAAGWDSVLHGVYISISAHKEKLLYLFTQLSWACIHEEEEKDNKNKSESLKTEGGPAPLWSHESKKLPHAALVVTELNSQMLNAWRMGYKEHIQQGGVFFKKNITSQLSEDPG